jgi:NitT/TauT family transport system substrate-binding protein
MNSPSSSGRTRSNKNELMQQHAVRCLTSLLALVAALASLACGHDAGPALTPVTVGLDFTISGYHAPWFVAKEKGYFAKEGLEVRINRGYSSGDTVKKLVTGIIDVGFAHPAHVILAADEDEGLKIVMGYFVNEMCTIYSYVERGNIRSPRDLPGKRWGAPAGDVCAMLLQPLAEQTGFDYDRIQFINMDAASRIPALVEGHIDATGSFWDKDILFGQAGRQAGLSLVTVRFARYLPLYSNSVITTNRLIREKPQVVGGVVRALVRGLDFTLQNPEEAAQIVLKHRPELDPEYVRFSASILAEATSDDTTRAHGRGVINPDKMAQTIKTIARFWNIENLPAPQRVYTNRFVKQARQELE